MCSLSGWTGTSHGSAYDDFFQVPVCFEAGWNAVRLCPEGLRQPIRSEPRYMFGIFSEWAETLVAQLASSRSFKHKVRLMPGMAGTELARTLQTSQPSIKVLVVSGYAEEEGIAPDLARLTKPFRNADLAASLAALD